MPTANVQAVRGSRLLRLFRLPLALFLIVTIFPLPSPAYYDAIHRLIAQRALLMIRRNDSSGIYKELLRYQDRVLEGSVAEDYGDYDGNERAMRHYYDPDAARPKKGVPYYAWFKIWKVKGAAVTPPAGGYYDGALEWARNGAGSKDPYNWEGALKTYGPSWVSTSDAYLSLGHVVHLLTDMTVLDHVMNIPHPGSYRKDFAGNYGFEGLCEDSLDKIRSEIFGKQIRRLNSLDDYFNKLAAFTKSDAKQRGLEAPLGLDKETRIVHSPFPIDVEIPWNPNIDPKTEGDLYLGHAKAVLNTAVEYCAGLMMDFCEIVRGPLYVKRLTIIGERGGLYLSQWEDESASAPFGGNQIRSRRRVDENNVVFDNRSTITIQAVIASNSQSTDDVVKENSVRIKVTEAAGRTVAEGTAKKTETGQEEERLEAWELSFIPVLKPRISEMTYAVEVSARDISQHYGTLGQPPEGHALDSQPGTAALRDFKPPYALGGFEPGPDRHHKFKVVRGSQSTIQLPSWIYVSVTNPERTRGELQVGNPEDADYAITIDGPFNDPIKLYQKLCPFLEDLSNAGFIFGDVGVAVDKKWLEKCDILKPADETQWKNSVDAQEKPQTVSRPAKPAAVPEEPEAPIASSLARPRTLGDIPKLLEKMGFMIKKTGGSSHGYSYWVIISDAALAKSFGFETGKVRLLGVEWDGVSYDGIFWGEQKGSEITVWAEWLDTSYVPKERSFPDFLRLYEK